MKTRKATIEATRTRTLVVVGVKAYRHPQIFFLRAEISQLNALDEPTIYWYDQ